MSEDDTERVTMLWPKMLKEQVKEKSGPRGLTEFTINAVEHHLGVAATYDDLQTDLNQTRQLVQVFADKLVLGGDSQDRLQSLVEADFPDWIDTSGWPTAFATLVLARRGEDLRAEDGPGVPREAPMAASPDGAVYVDESQIIRVPATPRPEVPTEPAVELESRVHVPTPISPAAAGQRDDLLAKVLEKTGQELPGVLTPASQIPKPPVHQETHNHSWIRAGGVLSCECGAYIDEGDPAYPHGVVRDDPEGDAEETSGAGSAPDAVQASVPEPSTPAPEPADLGV